MSSKRTFSWADARDSITSSRGEALTVKTVSHQTAIA
jgi:hypothetical protein